MSGFAVIYDRSNTPVDPGVLERVLQRLDHRGPDGRDSWSAGSIAIGHWHFWTTPEEVGERQPLKIPGLPYTIVLDGRLDNRSDLINCMSITSEEARHLSDAELILRVYDRWGTGCFKGLIGEFALVIWDEFHKELVCARDAVGDRTLFYTFQGDQVVIASEPWAIAAGLKQPAKLDERAVVCHFALQIPEDGQTFFSGVFELLPAHWMKVSVGSDSAQRYWQPTIGKRNRKRPFADYVAEFQALLEESVRCRLRSSTAPGIMLSGGLDSTSIACLAARLIAPEQLTTISYVFDEFPDSDERQYINAVGEEYGTRSIQVLCDEQWPYKTWPDWPMNPNWPPANPYRLILERTYTKARDEGLRVLLSGMYGDNLYARSSEWLMDLFWDGHILQLGQEISDLLKNERSKGIRSKTLTRAVKQIAVRVPGVRHLRRSPASPCWLTPYSRSIFEMNHAQKESPGHTHLLNLLGAANRTREIYNTSRFNLELRTPYHDRRMIEFALGLPAYTLFSMGIKRYILRTAMKGILPEIIRNRPGKTGLLSFYNYGVQKKREEIETTWAVQNTKWRKYIDRDFISTEWEKIISPNNDGRHSMLPVLSIFYELWYKSFLKDGIFVE